MEIRLSLMVAAIYAFSIPGSFFSAWALGESGEVDGAGTGIFSWRTLPDFPNGFGVASPFTGVSNGALVIAGGTHFEGEGEARRKIWTDNIYIYEKGSSAWTETASLEKSIAYGTSVNIGQGILCMGGSDSEKCYTDVFVLEWSNGKLRQTPWPDLPKPCMYLVSAVVDNVVYVAGGQEVVDSERPTRTSMNFWALNLSGTIPEWKELEPWPGPGRILPVAASQNGNFYLFSGVDLVSGEDGSPGRRYLKDAYRYSPEDGTWTRLADSPRVLFAAASPAFDLGGGKIAICGGFEGADIGSSEEEAAGRVGLFRDIFIYDAETDAWLRDGEIPSNQIVTNATRWGDSYVIPSGEVGGGGVRSLKVSVGTPR